RGKERDWRGRKVLSLRLADIFENLGYKKSLVERVQTCGDTLRFIRQEDGSLKLYQAYFCKNKLCPMCNWRRSMKYSYQTSRIVDEAIKQEPKGRFLFLTLTVKNVEGKALNSTISQLTKSFDRLFKRAKVQRNLLGYLRSVEVTHNKDDNSYHPHIHVLMMVKSSYFKGKENYISQKEWGEMWSNSLKVDYTPMIDIRTVKEKGKGLKGAILETAKYPTKPINLDVENKQVVDDLYNGLYRKRQLGYGGLFKTIKKQLTLDDVENGDLVHTSDDKENISKGTEIVAIWNANKQNYYLKK
ncbi:protein rep, partial [Streptococcus thermophilus]